MVQTQKVKIGKVKNNPNNPRIIKDHKFHKLVNSIKEFPKMLELRPIVVNDDMIVLGGNMRLKACKEAGLKEVFILKASDLSKKEQEQFIIKDNVNFGEWNWDELANDWESEKLNEWGLDVPEFEEPPDYGLLDDNSLDSKIHKMTQGVKRAIQIEFDLDDYEEAKELVKFWRDKKVYVGKMLIDIMNQQKKNL